MRFQPWTTVVACLLLASGSLARAQSLLPESGYFPAAPLGDPSCAMPAGPWGMGGDVAGPPGGYASTAGAVGAGGEVYAWPQISPYQDYPLSQHYVDDGLWHWQGSNEPRLYYFDVEGIFAKYRGPEGKLIGFEGAPPFPATPTSTFLPLNADVVEHGFYAFAQVSDPLERRGEQEPDEGGLRLTWGFFDRDESGLKFSAWSATEAYWFFQRGTNGNPFNFLDIRATAGLPLNDGAGGVTVPYDLLFSIDMSSHGAGADAAVYMTPRWNTSFIKMQPLWGFRYTFIEEGFGFHGRDSGAAYVITFPPGLVDPATFIPGVPYESTLESDVTSHVFGPEVGARMSIGGDNFRLIGESRFGFAANLEELDLRGNAIGDGFLNPNFRQFSPFRRSETHGHISPTMAHSFDVEMNILGLIPLVKRLTVLEQAKLRVGYSIVWVGEVARPYDTIEWNGLPLFPNIEVDDRTSWYIGGWDVGLHFEY
jgi:hypothetical protein